MRALRLDVVLTLVLHLDLLVTKGASQGHWQAGSAVGESLCYVHGAWSGVHRASDGAVC